MIKEIAYGLAPASCVRREPDLAYFINVLIGTEWNDDIDRRREHVNQCAIFQASTLGATFDKGKQFLESLDWIRAVYC
nr:hypothetical protein K4M20_00158 [Agrobacterium fabrum]UVY99845.1 hypothetical protein K4M19_00155 [Agrobacterium fabrum]